MSNTQNFANVHVGMLLTATSLVVGSFNASNVHAYVTTSFLSLDSRFESLNPARYISNDSIYYYPVPTDYRALYKSIAQSKWYITSHENKSLGEEMRIE